MAKPKQTRTQTSKKAATQTQTQQADSSSTNEVRKQPTSEKKPALGLAFSSKDVQSQLEVDQLGLANHRYHQIA